MDWTVIEQKLESLRRCLLRVREKCPQDVDILAKDYDAQDILTLNLTRAVQLCVDIGAHLVTETPFPPPDTMGQTFDILAQAGIINPDLAQRMKRAVGFRNLAIHNYDVINWTIVFAIAQYHLTDFEDFAKAVVMASSGTAGAGSCLLPDQDGQGAARQPTGPDPVPLTPPTPAPPAASPGPAPFPPL